MAKLAKIDTAVSRVLWVYDPKLPERRKRFGARWEGDRPTTSWSIPPAA